MVYVGEHTYSGGISVRFPGNQNLHIGKFCSLGLDLIVYLSGNHNSSNISTYPFLQKWGSDVPTVEYSKGDIIIGNDVWIGSNVSIVSGVKIGDGAIIGAHSVVARDVKPYTINAGNPCRFKKLRFNTRIIEDLLNLRWWNWPDDKIQHAVPLLSSNNIPALIQFNQHWEENHA